MLFSPPRVHHIDGASSCCPLAQIPHTDGPASSGPLGHPTPHQSPLLTPSEQAELVLLATILSTDHQVHATPQVSISHVQDITRQETQTQGHAHHQWTRSLGIRLRRSRAVDSGPLHLSSQHCPWDLYPSYVWVQLVWLSNCHEICVRHMCEYNPYD